MLLVIQVFSTHIHTCIFMNAISCTLTDKIIVSLPDGIELSLSYMSEKIDQRHRVDISAYFLEC